jgi:hypothetical protein
MMIYGTDPEARNVFVVQNGVRQEHILAFDPITGETIQYVQVAVERPLFQWLLERLGFTLDPDFLLPTRGLLTHQNGKALIRHYFMRPPFHLEYVNRS